MPRSEIVLARQDGRAGPALKPCSDPDVKGAPPQVPLSAVADPSAPTVPALATALQEQLGLKLESRPGPVDVLVIDFVQQPSKD
jgi:uncharacterized protein (TIGR03435 family)